MTQDFDREELNNKRQDLIKSFPERVPLDTKIIYKRRMSGYEEWKIEYTAEGTGTMPEPSGCRIPAYLLVPTNDRFKPPFPAMVCFHQCFCDCDIGKEAVVGKMVERPDQAYGFELVQQGFVVIAPDILNCGERNIPSIRQEGVRRVNDPTCGSLFPKHIGRGWVSKIVFDSMRAMDFLQSLDFVDSDRIGAIGHSQGSHITFWTMAYDQRIKAGILSGFDFSTVSEKDSALLTLIAPRLFVQFQGSYDGSSNTIQRIKDIHDFARKFYERENATENLILRMLPCGHHFLDQFKWEAYYKLKQYFGIAGINETLSLKDVLISAQTGKWSWWYWREDDKERFLKLPDKYYILANKETLASAFGFLFAFLWGKCPGNSSVNVHVDSDQENCYVVCTIPGGSDDAKSTYEFAIRNAEQFFFENLASLRRESAPDQVKYVVTLRKAG